MTTDSANGSGELRGVFGQVFSAQNFALEGGRLLPELRIAYETYGRLAPDGRNVILLTHGYVRGDRRLGYGGVGLVEAGCALLLLFGGYDDPQLYVVLGAVYLYGVGVLEWRRGARGAIKQVLESAALLMVLLLTFSQAAGFLGPEYERTVYSLLLLVQSVVFIFLGARLGWKKSFFGGGAAMVADIVLMLLDPVRALMAWGFWVTLFAFGVLLVVVVVALYWWRDQKALHVTLHQTLDSWD